LSEIRKKKKKKDLASSSGGSRGRGGEANVGLMEHTEEAWSPEPSVNTEAGLTLTKACERRKRDSIRLMGTIGGLIFSAGASEKIGLRITRKRKGAKPILRKDFKRREGNSAPDKDRELWNIIEKPIILQGSEPGVDSHRQKREPNDLVT